MFIIQRPLVSLLLCALLLAAFFTSYQQKKEVLFQLKPLAHVPHNLEGEWQFTAASDLNTRMVHSASMIELPDGRLRGFWFAGSREGAKDISINTAVFEPEVGQWTDESIALSRKQVSSQWGRYVRKLGNVVPTIDEEGNMRLFVVAVSFGGWAASRILVFSSQDLGESWRFENELKTSPFLNISTLTKGSALVYEQGVIGLPVYHEFLGKFGELLFVDANNDVVDKSRIGYGRQVIQPLILMNDEKQMTAFLRPHNKGLAFQSVSYDAGENWEDIEKTAIENPGAALGGVTIGPGHWLLANNCDQLERDVLCLLETVDGGKNWRQRWIFHDRQELREGKVHLDEYKNLIDPAIWADIAVDSDKLMISLEKQPCRKGHCEFIYDYPYMLQSKNGDLHLLYTWNKVLIRHAWLKVASDVSTQQGQAL